MTNQSHLFHTYTPSSGHEKICIAYGTFSPITRKGLIRLSPNICLKSTLHAPQLNCNLLSINKLAQDSNCSIRFFNPVVFFKSSLQGG